MPLLQELGTDSAGLLLLPLPAGETPVGRLADHGLDVADVVEEKEAAAGIAAAAAVEADVVGDDGRGEGLDGGQLPRLHQMNHYSRSDTVNHSGRTSVLVGATPWSLTACQNRSDWPGCHSLDRASAYVLSPVAILLLCSLKSPENW